MTNRPLPHILETIRATKQAEVAALLSRVSLPELEDLAQARLANDPPRPFESAVTQAGSIPNVIAEVKKASPSKGVIRADFDPVAIATAYRNAGATAISCLTDETYFQGNLSYLQPVREASGLPVLRKDFLIHPAQVLEAAAAGADAVLLIARMLGADTLAELYQLAKELSLGVLLEIHDESDLEKALTVSPTLIGVNNRDLDTFVVDMQTTWRLRERVPATIPLVAESGITTHAELVDLAAHNVSAVLVGEHLCRQPDIEQALRVLRGEDRQAPRP